MVVFACNIGTNVEAGKDILGKSGLKILAADDLDDAAKKVCTFELSIQISRCTESHVTSNSIYVSNFD